MDHMKPGTSWFKRLFSGRGLSHERRIAERKEQTNLVAHYWDGAAPLAHDIRDISSTGLYMLTEQSWYPGTLVMLSLQAPGAPADDPDRAITVKAKVVRSGADGVGLAFSLPEKESSARARSILPSGADRKTFQRFLERLSSRERRSTERLKPPNLVVHYLNGAASMAQDIRDISSTGLYLLTEQRWDPGALVMLSLQAPGMPADDSDGSITVQAKVVRSDADGVGFAFVLPEEPSPGAQSLLSAGADRKTFQRFLVRLRASRGQALVEYVLMLPLLFLLIVNVVNFGAFFFDWITVANAARAGADYAILAGSSVGAPIQATASQVNSLITTDVSSLPNNPSLTTNICKRFGATVTTLSGTCTSAHIPTDPESANYVLMSIDVTYTYQPLIAAGFQFPNLKIYATIPPTTIHRQAVMRLIQ